MKRCVIFCLFFFICNAQCKDKKIIALLAARNEEAMIEQCITGLSFIADSIIYLDDASTDNSVTIVTQLQNKYNIEKIIVKDQWYRAEAADKNRLLEEGRRHNGTHFIILDADEMVTANCLNNNFLRNKIFSLHPGESLRMYWISLWKGINQYNITKSFLKEFIFCDDGKCSYDTSFLHTPRIPANLKGRKFDIVAPKYGILHFQFVHWENFLIKQAWYQCLEKIRTPHKAAHQISYPYMQTKNELNQKIANALPEWFEAYDFFDIACYQIPEKWRKKQVNNWFASYGEKYFDGLNIWDVNWASS